MLADLRETMVTMVAVLLCYGSALLVEHLAAQRVDIVVLSVALSLPLARTQRQADPANRAISLLVLPVTTVAATELSSLMARHSLIGDALFAVSVGGTIWIRRFGPRATKVGTMATLPLVAILVVQAPGALPYPHWDRHTWWAALVALIAACWVGVVQLAASRSGSGEPPARPTPTPRPAAGNRRLRASTRMALQMGVALGGAFVAGHLAFGAHWTWTVLTAFIVCSGARGRGDVMLKGVQRAVGAALGTIVATEIAGAFGPREAASVVLIFAVLAVATWLRPRNYAYWAGSVTAVLSLLYGYYGTADTQSLLLTRLEAILAGAAIGITACWLILPVRTGDVLRRRTADTLAALSDFLAATRSAPGDLAALNRGQARFNGSLAQLAQIAPPLRAHSTLTGRWRPDPHPADAIDALHRCAAHVHAITGYAAADVEERPDPETTRLSAAVSSNITAIRLAIARKPGPAYQRLPAPDAQAPAAVTALAEIDASLAALNAIFPAA